MLNLNQLKFWKKAFFISFDLYHKSVVRTSFSMHDFKLVVTSTLDASTKYAQTWSAQETYVIQS